MKKQCLLSARARSIAVQRHSAQNIEKELLGAYNSILEDFKIIYKDGHYFLFMGFISYYSSIY